MDPVKTRVLIVSDTHGMEFDSLHKPLVSADVAIHCGDLTDGSKLDEFRTVLRLLRDINAPLKLIIAGNHDFTLDTPVYRSKIDEVKNFIEPDLIAMEYGGEGEARRLIDAAAEHGIVFLDEGNHVIMLDNGAQLKVYASPYTPSVGGWGFNYAPSSPHAFTIAEGTDIAITHGPPKGIFDYTAGRQRAGCQQLFTSVATARPAIHCFGHIHEGWGAKLVTWKDSFGEPSHLTSIDNETSASIAKLADLRPHRFDEPEDLERKKATVEKLERERCCRTSHCAGDERPLRRGEQTLFVNAAISSTTDGGSLSQLPFLVELDLPRLTE